MQIKGGLVRGSSYWGRNHVCPLLKPIGWANHGVLQYIIGTGMREVISLPYSPCRLNETRRYSINENGIRYSWNTEHHERYPLLTKTQFSHDGLKKDHSTWSYALLISSLRAMKPSLIELWFCIQWRDSKTIRILSEISQSFVKALWCSMIICGSIFFNLFANTLENILYKTLHSLMGWNLETNSGFSTLGIKVMKVWLRCSGREAEFKKERTDWVMSLLTKF